MQKSVFQTQFSPSKVNRIFLKMIFLFQYVIGRITFVKNFFPLHQNWKSLFTKNVPEIVWLRRSSKCKILKNHLSTKYFWVNTYLLLNVVLKIQYLWTPYYLRKKFLVKNYLVLNLRGGTISGLSFGRNYS